MKKIMDQWVFPYSPHNNQEVALNWLADNEDFKYLILESPVGSGKSNIGLTYSKYVGSNSFILTPQRILQEQYEESFTNIKGIDLASFYGKSNYRCQKKNTNCAIGGLVKPRCEMCPYATARDKAKASANTVMNYSLGLGVWAFTQLFNSDGSPKTRNLMILDEAHTLESHLVSFDALAVTEWRCKKYDIKWRSQTSIEGALEFIKETYIPAMTEVINELDSKLEWARDKSASELSKTELKDMQELASLTEHVFEHCMAFASMKPEDLEKKFVLVFSDMQFEFKRLTGAFSFKNIVEPMADQFLFMSSTILNKDGFCRDLGIDPSEAAFLSLGSEFDVANRPVYYMPQAKMNVKWNQPENAQGRKDMLSTIKRLTEMHAGESGIIHTANFKVAEWLVSNLKVEQDIFHHNPDSGDDRNSIIKAFMGHRKPAILISPSCTEGLDLKDDLGRFAMFVKTPYGFLGDQWIKRRMEMSAEWYQRQAIINIIQGGGRIVRGMQDTGTVYILDQSFSYLMSQTGNQIPQWWKDAYAKI
jgi:Rad3-related DNA helicase